MSDRERLGRGMEATEAGRPAAGETEGIDQTFDAPTIATAFDVAVDRVHNALRGEYGFGTDARVDSKQAQNLAEVLLGDQPLDQREAALMRLGAFTPRSDDIWGLGDKAPGEQSERLSDRAGATDEEATSPRSSYDPATNPADRSDER